jgi:hypothetical protein
MSSIEPLFSALARENMMALSAYRYQDNAALQVVNTETLENRLGEVLTLYQCALNSAPESKVFRARAYGDAYLWTLGLFAAKWLTDQCHNKTDVTEDAVFDSFPDDIEIMAALGVPEASVSAAVLTCRLVDALMRQL